MGVSALDLLDAVEHADREPTLSGWSASFADAIQRVTDARACQLLRVVDGGERLEVLGREDATTRAILAAGHGGLDPEQRRRIYRSGATVVTMDDVHGPHAPPCSALASAMRDAGIEDILGMVAPPAVSVGLFLPARLRLEPRKRQLFLGLAHHVGASVAVRSALGHGGDGEPARDDELPTRLRGALEELDRRRRWARRMGDADDAASALAFLGALSREGFAVVHATRTGSRRRLVAVRIKDSAGRAMRLLDAPERDVLERLERGLSLKEIAYELGIAEATVSNRIARIRTKLGVDPRCEVVRAAGAKARAH